MWHPVWFPVPAATAQYIPPLKDADPERFAVAVCTVDGQSHSFGDARDYYTLQSVSKPVTYAVAVQQDGAEFVDEFVWCEASGRPFNSHDLLPDQVRHRRLSCGRAARVCPADVLQAIKSGRML